MFRKILLVVVGFIFLNTCVFSNDLIGIYREESSSVGILIEPSNIGEGFIVHKVFLNPSGTIRQKFEWQSAFITVDTLPSILFYWKTGRYEDSIPESNNLIVYNLSLQNNNLVGTFYFPEENRMPPAAVTFNRIEN